MDDIEVGPAEIRTRRTLLVPLDADTARAITARDRSGRAWAREFPGEGDLAVASITTRIGGSEPSVPTAEPWRRSWLVVVGGEVAGTAGTKGAPRDGTVEIGYGLVPSVHGRGIATEAVGALVAVLGRAGVRTVLAETLVENHASRRVLEKLGFQRTGGYTSEEGELLTWRRELPS